MAKKSMKAAATAGTSVFDTIAQGAQYAQDVQDVQDVQSVEAVQPVKEKTAAPRMERLNLKIPAEVKEYLQAAAYRESSAKHIVSLTEYLCNLVYADMERHKDD